VRQPRAVVRHNLTVVRPRRKNLRLDGYDYANAGAYLVTVCTRGRRCTLGHIEEDRVALSGTGTIVHRQIAALPLRFVQVHVDAFVVMPNHVHVLLVLDGRARQASPLCIGRRSRQASPVRLGGIVGAFKAGSSREAGRPLWQRGYHDHVVRDEDDLARVRTYIETNPIRWHLDPENPERS
jgi:putative transposase